MRKRAWVILVVCAAVVVLGITARVAPNGGTIPEQIHWLIYGYDRISYNNRHYIDPQNYSASNVEARFGQGEKFIPTGAKVIGLPVYDTRRSLAFQKQHQVVSTLLFLKKPDDSFIVYSLSGDPEVLPGKPAKERVVRCF